ncbi:MAG: hypothetical protein ACYC55_09520, partial [Candidatus Geothermincolia bacterium]
MPASEQSDHMYSLVERVLADIGPRVACSEEEKRLGRLMAEDMRPLCDRVETETFTCSPFAFLGHFPFLIAAYVIAIVFYWIYPVVSAVLGLLALMVLYLETSLYKELIDPLFPKRQGENVVAFFSPSQEVRQRVVVSAHLD